MSSLGNIKRNRLSAAGMLVITMILGGCAMEKGNTDTKKIPFTNEEEAREYTLACMEERYGVKFVVAGDEEYTNYGIIDGYGYECTIASADEPDKTGLVMAYQSKRLADNWAANYFKEEAEKEVTENIADNDIVRIKEVSLKAPITEKKWEKQDGLEKFMKEGGAYIKVIGVCEEGLSDPEYAQAMLDFVLPFYELGVDTQIHIKIGEENTDYFFEDIKNLNEIQQEPVTLEEIEEEIRYNRALFGTG